MSHAGKGVGRLAHREHRRTLRNAEAGCELSGTDGDGSGEDTRYGPEGPRARGPE
jgi:hypothetical protein